MERLKNETERLKNETERPIPILQVTIRKEQMKNEPERLTNEITGLE